ncbi:2-isopropylmalate synthase [Burkholderia orbicola]|uniref:2-isopropylmalate synthase n=5 Tax=Burkholderia cepacia complex TaxID=87882 RepID=LEU1_BURO0|nr:MULTISPECIES: 2-isopropylmalate synthase [Burkholderia]A0K933.1 RecName: Full=2-isopropylmalate synthase; AltName: Full=Alpha-IPM synthase; AltName: Full=Alpha-isopropylmalate synthase [Burkholderia cenocepacia HI2424]B1JVQ1.1 RecName: Full=2-isopropylmalate synthase; AltName: Full=Alpha-IPM synthase; AltName: Full=Alpha-isopropylmalate synthase [Burkholderia orbicola MC0-3]Q1BV03.1 RecName: Full=2-isopropylmalate synthase; AltName: Full=Alpha-IPM synthase; AltName: Full=Alpha-isopropylmalate
MTDKLIIFDTTLRDGEQSPGASMTKEEKIRIAKHLERMKVDVIEAGFAASSNGDFDAIHTIAGLVKDSTICSLARANDKDIQRAADALKPANSARIHTFIATSPLHMEKKLRMTPDQVFEQARLAVRFARKFTDNVEFSPEDGSRSDLDFLCRVLEAVIAEGATTINIADTVGYGVPELYGNLVKTLRERIPNSDKAIFSVHCHNDLGMAVANSLAGVKIGGARQIECTINGLGERAGNTSLEEIVMAVKTRKDYFGLDVGIDTTQIVPTSKLVSQITGFVVQPNKAVVGANAFAHASGIHQDGVLKARDTYEIMRAEDVGWTANKIVLGKLSGRNAFKQRLQELGVSLDSEAELNAAFMRFKDLADRKAEIFDEDIIAIVSEESALAQEQEHFKFVSLSQRSETGEQPQAKVVFAVEGKEVTGEARGNGPVDATFNAIEGEVGSGSELLLYSVNAITTGTQAQGEVTVRLSKSGRIVNGVGTDPDIVAASAKAYISALNKLHSKDDKLNPQRA